MSGKGKKNKAKKKEEQTTSNIKDIIESFESVTADRDVDAELEAIAPPSSFKKSTSSSSSAKAAPASDPSSLLEDLAPPSASTKVAPSNFVVDLAGISEEDLKERVLDSWQLPFDTSRYFANAWQFFSQNAREIIVAMFLWIGSLLLFEYLFYRIFGTHSLTYTHRIHTDGVHYVHASQLRNPPPGSQGALVRIEPSSSPSDPTYQFLHVLSIFLHRVFIFYPIVASVYHAFFNALRRSTPLVTVSDFFAYFKLSRLVRLWPLASVLFMMTFAASLQVYLMPLWLYVHVITLFVIPLHVEHSHLSIGKYITTSIVLANGHIVACFMFLVLIWAANLLGLIFLLVGFLVSFPFGHFAVGFAYHDMVGIKGVKRSDLDRMAIA